MPMFETDAEFEAYVAQQQAELAGPELPEPAPRKKTAFEEWQRVLTFTVPLALAVLVGYFVWLNRPDDKPHRNNPWDSILGTAAWVGGREYDADADNLTDRLTFDKPLKKSKD